MRRRSRIYLQSVSYRIPFSPVLSARLLVAAPLPPHKSDQKAADKQAWSLLPARASVLHAHSLLASKRDSPIYIHVFVLSSEWGKRACTLVAGTQDGRWHAGRSLT